MGHKKTSAVDGGQRQGTRRDPPLAGNLPVRVELLEQNEAKHGARDFTLRISTVKGEVLLDANRARRSGADAEPRAGSPPKAAAFWRQAMVDGADAELRAESPIKGALFWRELAAWLGVSAPPSTADAQPPQPVPVVVLSMGKMDQRAGVEWVALKLVLGKDDHQAELYLNVGLEAGQGEFVEKDTAMRGELIQLLRNALGDVRGLPSVEPSSAPARRPALNTVAHTPAPFNVGDAVQHKMGPGTVRAVREMDVDGDKQIMLEVVLQSGIRMMIPAAAAEKELSRSR